MPWKKKGKRWCRKRGFVWAWETAIDIYPDLAAALEDPDVALGVVVKSDKEDNCHLVVTCGKLEPHTDLMGNELDPEEELADLYRQLAEAHMSIGREAADCERALTEKDNLKNEVEELQSAHKRDMHRTVKLMGELREARAEIDRLKNGL